MSADNPQPRRYVVIHGHFYQPPRENPWLGLIEKQESAHPFHDWTERITEECYRANAFSPVMADNRRIASLVNNFEHLSFNIGPTLISWLAREAPETYARILDGDRRGMDRRGGHGNALAQAYNHPILPLAGRRDQRTQVLWGLDDFARRFGHPAEGIWLPETAANTTTLSVLVECGVRYTVLAPSQLAAVRPLDGSGPWTPVENAGGTVQTRPYRIFPDGPGGGHVDVFFFHPFLSKAVSFEDLLRDGNAFADRVEASFDPAERGPQAVVLATDGETFGHHKMFGNMCLAYFFSVRAPRSRFTVTNFGQLLDLLPPTQEARLQEGPGGEGSAWSCAHGVGRWTRDCGCSTGGEEGWNQKWRTPLRQALDHLREAADSLFELEGRKLAEDPWSLRDAYAGKLVEGAAPAGSVFFPGEGPGAGTAPRALPGRDTPPREGFELPDEVRPGDPAARARLARLLELQYFCQLMYTSCGWFFADISGLEPVQDLLYARRAAEILEQGFGVDVERETLRILGQAKSNLRGAGSGARIWRRRVLPRVVTPEQLVAGAVLLELLGLESPLAGSTDFRLERLEVERTVLGERQVETGLCRLHGRLWPSPLSLRSLTLLLSPTEFRVLAERLPKAEERQAYGELREEAAHASPEELVRRFSWTFERVGELPPDMRLRLMERTLATFSSRTEGWILPLFRSRRGRNPQERERRGEMPRELRLLGGLALSRLHADGVRRALLGPAQRPLREARRVLKLGRLFGLEVDTTRGRQEAGRLLLTQLGRLEADPTLEQAGKTRQMIGLAEKAEIDPTRLREAQIRFWMVLEALRGGAARGPSSPLAGWSILPHLVDLGSRLGFHAPSVKRFLTEEGAPSRGRRVSVWRAGRRYGRPQRP